MENNKNNISRTITEEEIEKRCKIVQKAIEGGHFPIKQAMVAYEVTELDFIKYLLSELKN